MFLPVVLVLISLSQIPMLLKDTRGPYAELEQCMDRLEEMVNDLSAEDNVRVIDGTCIENKTGSAKKGHGI